MKLRTALLFTALAIAGCDSRYDRIEIDTVAGSSNAGLQREGFVVPEGQVLVFHAEPQALPGRIDYDVEDEVELRSSHPSIARVEAGVRSDTWMLIGRKQGRAAVEVYVNGNLEDHIPVAVELIPQAPGQGGE